MTFRKEKCIAKSLNILKIEKYELASDFSDAEIEIILQDLQNYKNGKSTKIEPLIVPLRYADENGSAQDLRPLATYRIK